MSSEHEFPWANQPLAVRTLLTGLTLPIAAPLIMALLLLVMAMGVLIVVASPFAYVIAGLRGKGDGQ